MIASTFYERSQKSQPLIDIRGWPLIQSPKALNR